MAARNTSPTSVVSAMSTDAPEVAAAAASRASSAASPPMSTPPTSIGDEHSVLSDAAKMDAPVDASSGGQDTPAVSNTPATGQSTPDVANSGSRRSFRSTRAPVATYNLQILAGTAVHTPTKYLEKHHTTVLHGALEDALPRQTTPPSPKRRTRRIEADEASDSPDAQLATEAAQAAQRRKSARVDLRKEAITKSFQAGTETVVTKGAELISSGKAKLKSALGATVAAARSNAPGPAARGRGSRAANVEEEETDQEAEKEPEFFKPKTKQWERHGLYVGQYPEFDARRSEASNRRRRQSQKAKENTVLPLPMFRYKDMLEDDDFRRDFKLPYDVYHPLPRKVKVDGWVKLHKNRFIGDASALWKRDKQDASQCYCGPEDGCGESCHNRIMAYECDATNCPLTPEQCRNRPFAQLKARAKGNGYDYGVEVMETGDKGYGVRAMRSFEPHQIIVEYAGEIITQTECERRMKQVYKKDKCYYLMSFDNKMIIDATRGTIARFVNHSCEPNCEMIKWTVGGEPRMALFAGSRGIMTGEELTYDYNFDPFSSKNIQECRCGTRNCRGVLGPKPKHQPAKEQSLGASIVQGAQKGYQGAKRKFQDVFGGGSESNSAPDSPQKKRKFMASAALTKTQNAIAEKKAAEEKAEREAAEKAAQKASRQNRALSRLSTSTVTVTTTTHQSLVNKVKAGVSGRQSLPAFQTTRKTTVSSIDRSSSSKKKSSASKEKESTALTISSPQKQRSSRQSTGGAVTSLLKRSVEAASAAASSSRNSKKRPRSPTPEQEESEDETPNITPASLRSASRKKVNVQQGALMQSKLPFKPLNLGGSSAKSAPAKRQSLASSRDKPLPPTPASASQRGSSKKLTDVYEVPDSDASDVDMEDFGGSMALETSAVQPPAKKRGNNPHGYNGIKRNKSLGAGVKKGLNKSVRGTKQAAGVAKAAIRGQGPTKSTIRMIGGDS